MKLKKRHKSSRMHGKGRGSHGWGARKKHISSGNRGGTGMSGTGKMAGHKKTLVQKLYGNEYFGKQGITSRGTENRKNIIINLGEIELNLESLKKKYGKKEKIEGKEHEILDLSEFKILADGDLESKLIIKAASASESAKTKIEQAGGRLILETESKESKE